MPIQLGRLTFGLSVALLGVTGLIFRDFAQVWQPVPTALPARTFLALVAAVILLVAGMAIAVHRALRPAGIVLAILFLAFALLWIGQIVERPSELVRWLGCAEQSALVIGALLASRAVADRPGRRRLSMALFGVCAICFGAAHVVYLDPTAAMVPAWLPGGQRFWALATALVDIAAGVALLAARGARIACASLGGMFVSFGLLVWVPMMVATGDHHLSAAGTALTFALAGAAWLVAGIAREPIDRPSPLPR